MSSQAQSHENNRPANLPITEKFSVTIINKFN